MQGLARLDNGGWMDVWARACISDAGQGQGQGHSSTQSDLRPARVFHIPDSLLGPEHKVLLIVAEEGWEAKMGRPT